MEMKQLTRWHLPSTPWTLWVWRLKWRRSLFAHAFAILEMSEQEARLQGNMSSPSTRNGRRGFHLHCFMLFVHFFHFSVLLAFLLIHFWWNGCHYSKVFSPLLAYKQNGFKAFAFIRWFPTIIAMCASGWQIMDPDNNMHTDRRARHVHVLHCTDWREERVSFCAGQKFGGFSQCHPAFTHRDREKEEWKKNHSIPVNNQ